MPKKIDAEKQQQLNRDNLYELYCIKHMKMQDIADIIGVSLGTVRLNLIKNNIEIRDRKIRLKPNLKFGMLTTINLAYYNNDGTEIWNCKCECGNTCKVKSTSLSEKKKKSCGCIKYDGHNNMKHNLCYTRLYNIHQKMISRCYKEYEKSYKYYGGRGITVCDEWRGENGFINFYNWSINNGYKDNLSIDRVDVEGNYCPSNCRWATYKTQQNNRTNNRMLKYKGVNYTLSELADKFNMPQDRLWARLKLGWDLEKALITPKMKKNK